MNRTMLLDIETQRDFLSPRGSCYTPAGAGAARQIHRLFDWAASQKIPVLSTVIRVRHMEKGVLSETPHCIEGTAGEKKLPGTILPRWIDLGLRNSTDLPGDIFERYQQVIVEKRETDIFAHARLERMITEFPPTTFVLCGVGLSCGIAQAAIGLRSRGFGVIVASDAVLSLDESAREMSILRMEAKGAIFVPTSEIISPKPRHITVPFRMPAHARR